MVWTRLVVAVALGAVALGEARGDTRIYGIPADCEIEVHRCSTRRDVVGRPKPERLSAVRSDRNLIYRAYALSPDGQSLLVHTEAGLELLRGGQPPVDLATESSSVPRLLEWSPDSQQVIFWVGKGPRRLALLDVSTLARAAGPGAPPPSWRIVHEGGPEHAMFGAMWSSAGEAILVLEQAREVDEVMAGVVVAIDPTGATGPREVVRRVNTLDFLMPPRARVGPAPCPLVVGHATGLLQVASDGTGLRRVSPVPASGLFDVEWSPDPAQARVLLFYRRPTLDEDGRQWQGVWTVDLGAAARGAGVATFARRLDDAASVHTLWFSPRGTFMTWATPYALRFARVDDERAAPVELRAPKPDEGIELEVHGCAWSADEARLAYTLGNQLWIHEVASGASYPVATIGDAGATFLAEPSFAGDDVIVASYTDMRGRPRGQ